MDTYFSEVLSMHFWFLNVIVPPICYDVWRPSKWYGRCCHGTWDGIFCVSKNRLEMLDFTGHPMFLWLGFLFLASRLILKKSQTCILQYTYRLQVSVLMILIVKCLIYCFGICWWIMWVINLQKFIVIWWVNYEFFADIVNWWWILLWIPELHVTFYKNICEMLEHLWCTDHLSWSRNRTNNLKRWILYGPKLICMIRRPPGKINVEPGAMMVSKFRISSFLGVGFWVNHIKFRGCACQYLMSLCACLNSRISA